jgi:hypothetical protein
VGRPAGAPRTAGAGLNRAGWHGREEDLEEEEGSTPGVGAVPFGRWCRSW